MRLIHIETLSLQAFEVDPPPYAILSHVWGKEEVSLKDFNDAKVQKKEGWQKIKGFCQTVRERNNSVKYVWVDTCCIDKSSSAELSEAINSMYRWYRDAEAGCYAFLSDVTDLADLRSSKWFTRGWTLQELLAPSHVEFYDRYWQSMGTKNTLASSIATISGIDELILTGKVSIYDRPIAQRMSWAAHRRTTRPEDRSYSLLGLFDINMPLLYGEGQKAFMRLQEEIIKQSSDDSIFAWAFPETDEQQASLKYQSMGMLATSIDAFLNSEITFSRKSVSVTDDYHLTNIGLSIPLLLVPYSVDLYLARLRCGRTDRTGTSICHILVGKIMSSDHYMRVRKDGSGLLLKNTAKVETGLPNAFVGRRKHMRVMVARAAQLQDYIAMFNGFEVARNNIDSYLHKTRGSPTKIYLHEGLSSMHNMLPMPLQHTGTAAIINISNMFDLIHGVFLKIGFDVDYNPWCVVVHASIPRQLMQYSHTDVTDDSWIPPVVRQYEQSGASSPVTSFESTFTCHACQKIIVWLTRKVSSSTSPEAARWGISLQRTADSTESSAVKLPSGKDTKIGSSWR